MKISILMPAKNADNFIGACVESILSQSFENWELIIVNDFSSDSTNEIALSFANQDKRITVLQNLKKGIIPALQLAFDSSSAPFVTRMDADDIMPPNKLQLFYDAILKYPKSVVTGKVNYFSNQPVSEGYLRYENWLNSLVDSRNFYASIYRECIIASPNWIVERSCFENEIKFANLNYPEDYDMVFKWYKSSRKIIAIDEVTHHWREHENRTSRHYSAYQQESFFKLKTNYFIDLEILKDEKIQLVGARQKGKLVAKNLTERNVNFDWFDFKVSEISQIISYQKIKSVFELKSEIKTILTVWPKETKTQSEILIFFEERGFVFGKNIWLF